MCSITGHNSLKVPIWPKEKKKKKKHVAQKSGPHLPSHALAPACHSSCLTEFTEPEAWDKQIDFVSSLERKQLSSENRYI